MILLLFYLTYRMTFVYDRISNLERVRVHTYTCVCNNAHARFLT